MMALFHSSLVRVIKLVLLLSLRLVMLARGQMVPAMYVFGDSLVDVGNNNYLHLSIIKANYRHNGIDFPNHKPSGRFSNGKNAADYLAEKLGLPSSPPYLSLMRNENSNLLTGVSFASGGAGLLNDTNQHYSITMNKQMEYYATVQQMMVQQLGQTDCDSFLSKSIFLIVIGSNDILEYFECSPSSQSKKGTPQQLVDTMLLNIKDQLKGLYDLGGRKFAVIGVGAVGCVPSQRKKNIMEACNEKANYWASIYNQGLVLILQKYKEDLVDFKYSYFDTHSVLLSFIQHPSAYGFKEVKAACCGLGKLKAKTPCLPIASYCTNRDDHVFWDFFHPSEATASMIIDTAFDGSTKNTFPMNIRQLVSI